MTRRDFARNSLIGLVSITLLGASQCNKAANTMLNALRAILTTLEGALRSLTNITGLLPDVIAAASKYLQAVTYFVEQVGGVLESDLSAAEKTAKILSLGTAVVLPTIANPQVAALLGTVQAAVEFYLAMFKGRSSTPDVQLNDADRRFLATIENQARIDSDAVQKWAAKAK